MVFRLLSKIAGERWIGEGACGVVVWVNSATASGQAIALSVIAPERANFLDGHELDLLGKACAIQRHKRIVSSIGGTAKPVFGDNDAEAVIDGAENRGQHADVGFRARDDDRVDVLLQEHGGKAAAGERGICGLVEDGRGWHEPCERRNEVKRTLRQMSPRRL